MEGAKGTILIQKYLPKINPFISVELIENIEKWEINKDKYNDYSHIRPDSPIGDKAVRLEGSDGMLKSVPQMIEEMKRQNPNSALLITKTKNKQIPRYEDDGGFAVLFDKDKNVIIELVGKGFDGRELTHGKTVHESYTIPWGKILYIKDKSNLVKDKDIIRHTINQKDYDYDKKERIDFLVKHCNYDKKVLEKKIPKTYKPVENEIIKQIIEDIIFELYIKKEELSKDGLNYFWVQGNIINGKVEPWELSTIDF